MKPKKEKKIPCVYCGWRTALTASNRRICLLCLNTTEESASERRKRVEKK